MSAHASCANCGNIDFEDENGILVCTNCGRQQEGGAQQTGEDDEHFAPGKITKRKIGKTKTKTSRIYRGTKAYRLYLQAWQHILWKQVYILCHDEAKLPEDLWLVVKDLWTLVVSRYVGGSDSIDVKTASTSTENEAVTLSATKDFHDPDTIAATRVDEARRPPLKPKLHDTLSLIYIACLLLQFPFSAHTLHKLVGAEKIPYIHAIRHVPYEMSSKLPSEYRFALDTVAIPSAKDVYQNIVHLADELHQDFGLCLPTLNWKPLLLTHIQYLGLPIEVYSTIQHIGDITDLDFSYTLDKNHETEGMLIGRNKRKGPTTWPEVQLLSLLTVAVKLLFPFAVEHENSTAGVNPKFRFSWSDWFTVIQSYDGKNLNSPIEGLDQALRMQPSDMHGASNTEIDRYLDWYENTWPLTAEALADKKTKLEQEIISMFSSRVSTGRESDVPMTISSNTSHNFQLDVQAAALQPASTGLSAPNSLAVEYELYPHINTLGSDTTDNFVYLFHKKVAERACIDIDRFLRAVRHVEGLLERWCDSQKRDEVFGPVGDPTIRKVGQNTSVIEVEHSGDYAVHPDD